MVKADAFRQYTDRQTIVVSTYSLCQPCSNFDVFSLPNTDTYYIVLPVLPPNLNLLYLYRDVLFLSGFLWSTDIWYFFVWRGLAADGTRYGSSMRPHAVLFDNNWNAFITETVPTGQYWPLKKKTHRRRVSEMPWKMTYTYKYVKRWRRESQFYFLNILWH